MSKKKLDPKAVEEFLILNPDFLSQNSKILNSIEIVHETGGAVSLIQKQVELLRKNYESTSGNLLQLIDIAKANEEIFDKTKQLLLSLIICRNLSDIISTTESSFVKEFGADSCKLLFFKENANLPKGRILGSFLIVMVPVPMSGLFLIIVTNLNSLNLFPPFPILS